MKKVFVSALLLGASVFGYAQLLNVASVEKVALPEGVSVNQATMSPDGSYVVISQNDAPGLHRLDFASKAVSKISDNGSSLGIQFSTDGKQVIYRESTIGSDKLRRTSLKSVNIATGKSTTLVKPTRNLQGFAVNNGTLMSVDKGTVSTKALGAAKVVATPVASIDHGRLMVTVNGKTTNISPQGSEGQSYLWPSVSPDGTRVLYYLSGVGAFICNLDGSNPVSLGIVRAPQWYNNDVVVGMNDTDNGHVVLKSKIVAVKADGSMSQKLTEDSSMGMYPTVSKDGSKISYSTPSGDLNIINIK